MKILLFYTKPKLIKFHRKASAETERLCAQKCYADNLLSIHAFRFFILFTVIHRVSATRNDVRRLLSPVQTTPIAFTAYLDKTISHLGINHVIPFDKVLLNEGNAFNTHTGMFHCPRSGIYLFSYSVESDRNGVIVAKLVIDGSNQLDVITDGTSGQYQMAGVTAIVRVTAGQSVWVATYQVNDRTLFDDDNFRYTAFSGVLLY